jgi:hypothetical protein
MQVYLIAILTLLGIFGADHPAAAEKSNACVKDCVDYLKVCRTAHSVQACKSEHDICMSFCKKK